MKNARGWWLGALSAVLLACLTLAVFFELQDYGPESAIRRFNKAVLVRNDDELQKVTSENIRSGDVRYLVGNLALFAEKGATLRLEEMERSANEVRAVVLFVFPPDTAHPSGTILPMVWVVIRKGKFWLIDAGKTATILRDNWSSPG